MDGVLLGCARNSVFLGFTTHLVLVSVYDERAMRFAKNDGVEALICFHMLECNGANGDVRSIFGTLLQPHGMRLPESTVPLSRVKAEDNTATFVTTCAFFPIAIVAPRDMLIMEAFMRILWALIIGLVIGAVAKLLMPGKDPGGVIITSLIGVAGSLLATFLGQTLGWYERGQAAGFIASVVGAILLLSIYRMFRHRTA